MDFEIIYEDDTELAEFEAMNKGYRGDVVVVIENKKYKVYITSMIRLKQDFETEQQYYGYYIAEPNTLFVNHVTKNEIKHVITEMYKQGYFEKIDYRGFEKMQR